MGYNKRPSMVTQYAPMLAHIEAKISEGKEARFSAPVERLPTERDKLHAILLSAKTFTQVEDGRYAHLRDQVRVIIDWANAVLVVKVKETVTMLEPARPNETHFVEHLRKFQGNLATFYFWPSPHYEAERLEAWVEEVGFHLARDVETGEVVEIQQDDGSVMISAMRSQQVKRATGFSILDQLKSKP